MDILTNMLGAALASLPVYLLYRFEHPGLALWLGIYLAMPKGKK
jgi:hypothetical protein